MLTLEPIDKQIYLQPKVSQVLQQASEIIKDGQYKFVTASDVAAVADVESNCDPIFHHEDPLFIQNMGAAAAGSKLPKQMIWEAILIKKGTYSGQMAKFRFEPAYWEWTQLQKYNSLQVRMMMACSFGISQQMMRWVAPIATPDEVNNFIENFKSDINIQLKYMIGALDKLLERTDNNLNSAYRGYNSGNVDSTNPAVLARAEKVARIRNGIRQELGAGAS